MDDGRTNEASRIDNNRMATRLQGFIPRLVSLFQTAFTKGRTIMESYMVAKEYLSFYHKNKLPALLLKIDFAKAFDTVSWTFLTNLLVERGFPAGWISCLLDLLNSSTSSIKLNGETSRYFRHKRGLRQGDPLSPLLFIIVADVLQSFISNCSSLTSGPIILPPKALQYADDTIILMEATPRNVIIINEILHNFAKLTGLAINRSKCSFVPIAVPEQNVATFAELLQIPPKELPITYLGLPLSIRRLKRIHFKPLIDAAQRKLDGWQARFLSLGGRLTLVKSVLSALPLHFMQTIRLPTWLIKHLEGMRRSFFWKGREKCLGGHCLVNWARCCLPKKNGGLGIVNLSIQNDALLTKWLWKLHFDTTSTWTTTVLSFYGTTDLETLSSIPNISHGFRDILQLRQFYHTSINRALHSWKWSSSGSFTVSSAYRVLVDPGVISPFHKKLWHLKAPPRVQIFLWVLLQDRLLTQDNLMLRGWPSIQSCRCCSLPVTETAAHLFIECHFARLIWTDI